MFLNCMLHHYTVSGVLKELTLSLALKCLSFDFIGTSVDESSEEFGTLQVISYIMRTHTYMFYLLVRFYCNW